MADANILISGCTNPRCCFEILNLILTKKIDLVLSEIIIREASKNIHKKFPNFADKLDNFLSNCPFELLKHPAASRLNSVSMRDTKDIPILISIVESGVDFFVTGDKDFLEDSDLNRKYKDQFTMISPKLFLKNVMRWPKEDIDRIGLRTWKDLKDELS